MTTLLTWIHTVTSCTTIFTSGSPSFLLSEPQRAMVNSEIPWDFLNSPDVIPDCAILLIDDYVHLSNATNLVLKTRKEITVVLVLDDKMSSNYADIHWNVYQSDFDIHILATDPSGVINGLYS